VAAAAADSSSAPLATPPPAQSSYPALPPGAQTKAPPKRPSAIINKAAVARVQAQQAAMKAQPQASGVSPQDMQGLGESLGDALRTFRQAAADVRNSIDPQMHTIKTEMDAAQKEIEQSLEAAKQMPPPRDEPPKSS
jgi:Sec-independent protein translocase protein TatA